MIFSAAADRIEAVAHLARRGALLDRQTDTGRTALHVAAAAGYTRVVLLLLRVGANKNVKDKDGISAGCSTSFFL